MKLEFTVADNKNRFEVGSYLLSSSEKLFQIISDNDKGLALLSVVEGKIESEFHDSIEDLLVYTTLDRMKLLKQVGQAHFEIK